MTENILRVSSLFERDGKTRDIPCTTFSAVRITRLPRHHHLLNNQYQSQSIKINRNKQDQSNKLPLNERTTTSRETITHSASISQDLRHDCSSAPLNSNKCDNDKSPIQNISSAKSMQKLNTNHEHDFNIFSSVKKQPSERVKLPDFQNIIGGVHNGILSSYGMQSKRVVFINENDHNTSMKKRRKRKDNCCCSCLCIIIALIVALIIGTVTITTAVVLSRAYPTTTITTTTVTTATTTTETTSTTTSTTTQTTTTPYSCGNMTVMLNTDFLGFDIGNAGGVTWTGCCTLCLLNSTCQSFTYLIPASTCYLKTTPTYNGTYSTTHMSARY